MNHKLLVSVLLESGYLSGVDKAETLDVEFNRLTGNPARLKRVMDEFIPLNSQVISDVFIEADIILSDTKRIHEDAKFHYRSSVDASIDTIQELAQKSLH